MGKHFDEIIVQSIVELVLQVPGELGMVQIAGMHFEHVGGNRDGRVLQIDQNFDPAIVLARGKCEQRMIIELQVIKDFPQSSGVGHRIIVLTGRSKTGKGARRDEPRLYGRYIEGNPNTLPQAAIRIEVSPARNARLVGGMAR